MSAVIVGIVVVIVVSLVVVWLGLEELGDVGEWDDGERM
jgi:hypothetical protein